MWEVYDKLRDIGVCWVSPTGDILRSNPTFAGFFGHDRIHVEKLTIYQLTSMEDQGRTADSFKSMRDGVIDEVHCENKYKHPNGSVFSKTMHAIKLPDDSVMKFVYDQRSDNGNDQQLLLEVLRVLTKPEQHGVTVNVSGDDNRRTASADRGGIAKIGNEIQPPDGRSLVIMVLICILITLVLVLFRL